MATPFRHRISYLAASLTLAASSLLICTPTAFALAPAQQTPATDNSAMNKDHGTTADNQSSNAKDRQIARDIRKAIVADKSLSVYAKNVKVIVKGGAVTLRGPVRSDDEKKQIESYASQSAAGGTVTNELTVKAS